MKITTASVAAFLLAGTSLCCSQAGYVPGQPSIDCTEVQNTVGRILCSGPEAAQTDWDFNSAWWALYFTVNDTRKLDMDQQAWRTSLDRICALPRQLTQEEQTGQSMAQVFGRMIVGPGLQIPGPQPITQANVICVLNAYHARTAWLRSNLKGDALAESQLSTKQHAELQEALALKGFLRPDQIGYGTHDGEFGPVTRSAIKQFQQSLGASPSGFLSGDQRSDLLEPPAAREARLAKAAKAAADEEAKRKAVAIAEQDARDAAQRQAAKDAADEEAKRKAEIERLEEEASAAKEWRRKIDEARIKGAQYAEKSDFKWSLSEIDNPMTDDKDYTVTSAQPNKTGAIADVEGTCQKPGRVTFVANLSDSADRTSPLGLPDFAPGYIAGNKRINDDPVFPERFPTQKYRNSILVSTLLSLDPVESIESTWRVLAEVETARGRIIIQIPMFNANVQKLLIACGKQYENAKKRGGLPDAPIEPR
jgi:peptidoglycan hydrolase-like protein with peptidoglycan-binding domain